MSNVFNILKTHNTLWMFKYKSGLFSANLSLLIKKLCLRRKVASTALLHQCCAPLSSAVLITVFSVGLNTSDIIALMEPNLLNLPKAKITFFCVCGSIREKKGHNLNSWAKIRSFCTDGLKSYFASLFLVLKILKSSNCKLFKIFLNVSSLIYYCNYDKSSLLFGWMNG